MIWLYSGTPGSGKSLHMSKDIVTAIKQGRTVIANIFLNRQILKGKGEFIYRDNSQMTVDFLIDYAVKNHRKGKESQSLIIFDECAIMFNSRDFKNSDRSKWVKFFQIHRHYGYNIILVAQHDRLIDRQIRAFIEYNVIHRKANNLGNIGLLLTLFRIQLFVAVTYWYGVREKVGSEFFRYKKIYSRIYDSYQGFGNSSLIEESEKGQG